MRLGSGIGADRVKKYPRGCRKRTIIPHYYALCVSVAGALDKIRWSVSDARALNARQKYSYTVSIDKSIHHWYNYIFAIALKRKSLFIPSRNSTDGFSSGVHG